MFKWLQKFRRKKKVQIPINEPILPAKHVHIYRHDTAEARKEFYEVRDHARKHGLVAPLAMGVGVAGVGLALAEMSNQEETRNQEEELARKKRRQEEDESSTQDLTLQMMQSQQSYTNPSSYTSSSPSSDSCDTSSSSSSSSDSGCSSSSGSD